MSTACYECSRYTSGTCPEHAVKTYIYGEPIDTRDAALTAVNAEIARLKSLASDLCAEQTALREENERLKNELVSNCPHHGAVQLQCGVCAALDDDDIAKQALRELSSLRATVQKMGEALKKAKLASYCSYAGCLTRGHAQTDCDCPGCEATRSIDGIDGLEAL